MTPGRRSRYVTIVVAAVLAGGVLIVLPWDSSAPDQPATATAVAHGDDMSPRAQIPAPHLPQPASSPARAVDEVPSARMPARQREPALLEIPELGIEAQVLKTWMDASGSIVVPEDVLLTGWFDGSRRLDAPYGSTVIVGHRDSAVQGTGALYAMEELPLGSAIAVTDRAGAPHAFVVESVELIDKQSLPQEAPRIFTHRGPYRLVLITCGGAFDEGARSYESNVVITALPASADSD